MTRPVTITLLCVLMVGCGIIGPTFAEYEGLRPLDPIPAEYRRWHEEVEECADQRRGFDRIEWYVADEITYRGLSAGGVWRGTRITMWEDYVLYERAVKSELIHYVLNAGNSIHGSEIYEGCALKREV